MTLCVYRIPIEEELSSVINPNNHPLVTIRSVLVLLYLIPLIPQSFCPWHSWFQSIAAADTFAVLWYSLSVSSPRVWCIVGNPDKPHCTWGGRVLTSHVILWIELSAIADNDFHHCFIVSCGPGAASTSDGGTYYNVCLNPSQAASTATYRELVYVIGNGCAGVGEDWMCVTHPCMLAVIVLL